MVINELINSLGGGTTAKQKKSCEDGMMKKLTNKVKALT